MDEYYRRVLENTQGGVDNALVPYQLTAVLSGLTTGVCGVGALFWSGMDARVQKPLLLICAFLFVWTVGASVTIMLWSTWHGRQRARPLEVVAGARRQLRQRRREAKNPRHSVR